MLKVLKLFTHNFIGMIRDAWLQYVDVKPRDIVNVLWGCLY